MEEILVTQDYCMKFLVWSYFINDIIPEENTSYKTYKKFKDADCEKLDKIKNTVLKCFDADSINRACHYMQIAKINNEPSPYSTDLLKKMFA